MIGDMRAIRPDELERLSRSLHWSRAMPDLLAEDEGALLLLLQSRTWRHGASETPVTDLEMARLVEIADALLAARRSPEP